MLSKTFSLRTGVAKNEMDHEAFEEEQRWRHMSFSQKAGDWALRYRWHLFVAGWATSMSAAWLILRRNKTQTFSQKIVQARVYVSPPYKYSWQSVADATGFSL